MRARPPPAYTCEGETYYFAEDLMDYSEGPFEEMQGSVFDFVADRQLVQGTDYIMGREDSAGGIRKRTRASWSTRILFSARWVAGHYDFSESESPSLLHPVRIRFRIRS